MTSFTSFCAIVGEGQAARRGAGSGPADSVVAFRPFATFPAMAQPGTPGRGREPASFAPPRDAHRATPPSSPGRPAPAGARWDGPAAAARAPRVEPPVEPTEDEEEAAEDEEEVYTSDEEQQREREAYEAAVASTAADASKEGARGASCACRLSCRDVGFLASVLL